MIPNKYTCQLFLHESGASVRVASNNNAESIVFNAEDVATFLGDTLKHTTKYLDSTELFRVNIVLGTDELGTHIDRQQVMTEQGLFHVCLNHTTPELYTPDQRYRAKELAHWATHKVIPQVLKDKESK